MNTNLLKSTFDQVTLDPERARRIEQELIRRSLDGGAARPRHRRRRPLRTVALIAAAAALLTVTAYAAVSHSDFFQSVFGTGVAGREVTTEDLVDEDGNVWKTYEYPAMERVEVDEELAEDLVGEQTVSVDQTITLGGYSLTVRDFVIDENGIGVATIEVTNPDGLGFCPDDIIDHNKGEYYAFTFSFSDVDFYEYRDQSSTDTTVRYACYFTPESLNSTISDITVEFCVQNGEYETLPVSPTQDITHPLYDCTEFVISASEADTVSAVTFTGDTITASVSPVGMKITFPAREDISEYVLGEIIIHYADGSEYVVKGEDVNNTTVAYELMARDEYAPGYEYHQTTWYAFNRLADMDNIESITLSGSGCSDIGDDVEVSETLLPSGE